jgi:hypothetical protein
MANLTYPRSGSMDKQHPGTLIDLENRFWQSIVDQNTDAALELAQ